MSEINVSIPKDVEKAILISYGTIILVIIRSMMDFPLLVKQSADVGGVAFILSVQALTCGFLCLIIFFVGKRKNWARYILIFLTIIGAPVSVKPLIESLINEPISGLLGVIQCVGQLIVLILLCKLPAREWFRKRINGNPIAG